MRLQDKKPEKEKNKTRNETSAFYVFQEYGKTPAPLQSILLKKKNADRSLEKQLLDLENAHFLMLFFFFSVLCYQFYRVCMVDKMLI